MIKKSYLMAFVLFSFLLCSPLINAEQAGDDDKLIIWLTSDHHLNQDWGEGIGYDSFRYAINDTRDNISLNIDYHFGVGDMMHSSIDEYYDYYYPMENEIEDMVTRGSINVTGNHESYNRLWGSIHSDAVRYPIPDRSWVLDSGNTRFIGINYDNQGSGDNPFSYNDHGKIQWFNRTVQEANNYSMNVVVICHVTLNNTCSNTDFSEPDFSYYYLIKESSEYQWIIENFGVDMWLSGHNHGMYPSDDDRIVEKWDCLFANIGTIQMGGSSSNDCLSTFLIFDDESDTVQLKTRNHYDNDTNNPFWETLSVDGSSFDEDDVSDGVINYKLSYDFDSTDTVIDKEYDIVLNAAESNVNISVSSEDDFSEFIVNDTWIKIDKTDFNITSTNPINLTLSYLNDNLNPTEYNTRVLEFTATTTGTSPVYFNISGFPRGTEYQILFDNALFDTVYANSSGTISFESNEWSSHTVKITTPIQTTPGSPPSQTDINVIIYVKNKNDFPVRNAQVTIDGITKTTDLFGETTYRVPEGIYDVTIQKNEMNNQTSIRFDENKRYTFLLEEAVGVQNIPKIPGFELSLFIMSCIGILLFLKKRRP